MPLRCRAALPEPARAFLRLDLHDRREFDVKPAARPPSMKNALIKRTTAVVLAVLSQSAALLAVPANDNFAARAVLSPSGALTTINNSGASLEAEEPVPSGYTASTYQATAWWSFSPAAFDGWYQIETTGSTVDTVLAIWTGSSFAFPLTLVHVNDEAAPGSGSSMIRFFASAAVSYKISVASRSSARGTVALKATTLGDGPFASLIDAAFSPLTVNVGGAPAATTATVTIDTSYSVDSGQLRLFDPAGSVVATAAFSSANLIDPFGMDYAIPITLPANSTPGGYRWSVSFHTNSITSFPDGAHGWEALSPVPAGAPQTVTVISDSYANWLAANSMSGADSVRNADYDNDGSKNLIEFACGSNPRSPVVQAVQHSGGTITQTGLPVVSTVGSGDQQHLRIEFVRRLNDPSLTYTVEFSDDLASWTSAANAPVVVATSTSFEIVAVEDVVTIPAKTRRHARVRVTQ